MMKIWLYSTILWLTSLFIGCDNVAVGYLYTNEASYSMDTLQVTRFSALENNIRELKRIFDQYTPEIQDLLAETDQLETEFVSLQERKDELYEAYKQAKTAFNNEVVEPAESRIRSQKNTICSMCEEVGVLDPYTLREEIAQLQEQIDKSIPWTTAQIEQVLGTEPLQYTLYSVKSVNGQEAADDFAQYVTVIGGGRMYVDAKVDSPAGCYTVSLKVENEGHSAILTDIFTFDLRDN